MESSLGWIDLSPAALRRLRQELDPETDGVVDEMGVGALHTGYADHFFPGTSVLHTRPRYAFFTCWNYLSIDTGDGDAVQAKEDAELWVRNQLLKSGQPRVSDDRLLLESRVILRGSASWIPKSLQPEHPTAGARGRISSRRAYSS